MAHNLDKTLIMAPVSISDVQEVLGLSTTDLGFLIQQGNINKWAKYKPIRRSVIGVLTDIDRTAVNYGISSIPTWDNINKMATFWLAEDRSSSTNWPECDTLSGSLSSEYWAYTKPTGGTVSPYRLADFAKDSQYGYFHNAESPIKPMSETSLAISSNGELTLMYECGSQNDLTLKYSDLKYANGNQISLSGFYFGVLLCRTNNAGTKYALTSVTADASIEYGVNVHAWFENKNEIDNFFGNSSSDAMTFYVMPFFANDEIYESFTRGASTYYSFKSSLGSLTADKFVALLPRQQVTITRKYAEGIINNVSAWKVSGDDQFVHFAYTITNSESDINHTFTINQIVYDSNNVELASTTRTETITGGGSFSVTGGDDDEGKIRVNQFSAASKFKLEVYINSTYDNAVVTRENSSTVDISNSPSPDA